MTEWLHDQFSLSVDEANLIVAIVAIIVPVLIGSAVPAIRNRFAAIWRRSGFKAAVQERRYSRWFVATHRKVYNLYLDMYDELDLHHTYVALSFRPRRDTEQRLPANLVLADRTARCMIIVGDPGSGKSTLIKAYGVGILRHRGETATADLRLIRRSPEIPFFVPLRRFARALRDGLGLGAYLISEVLVHDVGLPKRAATDLMRRLLNERRCLVLLDGLDEVPAPMLDEIREAVQRFITDRSDVPTHLARVIITCRRQNFLAVGDQWLPSFVRFVHTLSPLRDEEILQYARNLRGQFHKPRTPDAFLAELRASGTLEYHRTPLVLAISTGLYLGKRNYRIPRSITLLYEAMVTELLGRHDFRLDPVGRSSQFRVADKYRLLRAFALANALANGTFAEFRKRDLVNFVRRTAQDMDVLRPRQAEDLVNEIIGQSGLLTEVSDEGHLILAHRSIHEFLAATELSQAGEEGVAEILHRAADPEWRQVVLVFAALDHAPIRPFFEELAARDTDLAGHCLAVADVGLDLAQPVLDSLAERFRGGGAAAPLALAALMSAARSPDDDVRTAATDTVRVLVTWMADDPLLRLDSDEQALLRVIETLSQADVAPVAGLMARLAALVPDQPAVVGPLWRCLPVVAEVDREAGRTLVGQMLSMAMDPACFAQLRRQPRQAFDWLTPEARRYAYPFRRGLDSEENLVTLLAWADRLQARPSRLNVFLQARWDSPAHFAKVESSRRRTPRIALYWPAYVLSVLACCVAVGWAVERIWRDPDVLFYPFGWRTMIILPWPIFVSGILAWILQSVIGTAAAEDRPGVISLLRVKNRVALQVLGVFVIDVAVGIVFTPLLTEDTVWLFMLAAGAALYLVCFLPILRIFERDRRLYLLRPNPYLHMYEDPQSAHWIRSQAPGLASQQRADRRRDRIRAWKLGSVSGSSDGHHDDAKREFLPARRRSDSSD